MIRFLENHSLKAHNTFNIDAKARYFFEFTELEDLPNFLAGFPEWKDMPTLIIGKGSNLLFIDNFEGLVIHPQIKGIGQIDEDRDSIYIEVGAGVEWDEVVSFAVNYKLGGLENLSLIPGNTGAATVQNIGAYGVEICDCISLVRGFDLQTFEAVELKVEDCQYAYRDSIFKNELKGRFIVSSVVLKLEKYPSFKLAYGGLQAELEKKDEINLANIRNTIIDIRQSKLPDPQLIGNAGSFFMNPIVAKEKADKLTKEYPNMPTYPANDGYTKLAAAWLIDQCGWKGFRRGDAGVHENQALVLVNYGIATGKEIVALANEIKQSVKETFGVDLQEEVNFIPNL